MRRHRGLRRLARVRLGHSQVKVVEVGGRHRFVEVGHQSQRAVEGTVLVVVLRNRLVVVGTGLEVAYHTHHVVVEEIALGVVRHKRLAEDLEVGSRLAAEDMEVVGIGLAVVRILAVHQAVRHSSWGCLAAAGMTFPGAKETRKFKVWL